MKNRYKDQSYVNRGEKVLDKIEKFINKGEWWYGLKKDNGVIYKSPRYWPRPIIENNMVQWKNSSCEFEPLIWFGIKGRPPMPCWSIKCFYGSTESNEARIYIDKFRKFWFNKDFTIDWDAILERDSSEFVEWAFGECGCKEPDLTIVRENCPVVLCEEDGPEQINRKIYDLFLSASLR